MAKVILDSLKIAKSLSDHVSQRIRLDFVAEGKRKYLGPEFDENLRDIALKIVDLEAIPVVDYNVKEQYKEMLNDVATHLKSGFPPGTYKPFSAKYASYKRRKFPKTAHLFWKRSGELAKVFKSFSSKQATVLGRTTVITLVKRQNIYRGLRFRITLNSNLPKITASAYRDVLFRHQFLDAENPMIRFQLLGLKEDTNTFQRMAYNEDMSMRPFIRKLVAEHGRKMQALVDRKLRVVLG